MIQDIAPHRYDVAYRGQKVCSRDWMLIYQDQEFLCRQEGRGVAFPTAEEIAGIYPAVWEEAVFYFQIDGCGYYGLPEAKMPAFGAYHYIAKEELREVRPIWLAFAGITGHQIYKWYTANRFCGRCGARMKPHGSERAMQCTVCGEIKYPQICPSVIVGILNGDQILLTKYAPAHSSFRRYALVAGYTEVGESLEDTVRREVMEEVGLQVKNIRYYKSQPWPFSDALLAGFFCDVDGSAEIRMDRGELSAAEWFEREQIPEERSESSISLTGEMMEAFRDGLV